MLQINHFQTPRVQSTKPWDIHGKIKDFWELQSICPPFPGWKENPWFSRLEMVLHSTRLGQILCACEQHFEGPVSLICCHQARTASFGAAFWMIWMSQLLKTIATKWARIVFVDAWTQEQAKQIVRNINPEIRESYLFSLNAFWYVTLWFGSAMWSQIKWDEWKGWKNQTSISAETVNYCNILYEPLCMLLYMFWTLSSQSWWNLAQNCLF